MRSEEEVIEEYPHGCRLVHERVRGDADKIHYDGPMGRVKTFRDLEKARLYADVQAVTGGFREEKTGERGVPPAVARAREDVLMAYLAAQPTMGFEWVSRFYDDVNEEVIRGYISNVRTKAAKQREKEGAGE